MGKRKRRGASTRLRQGEIDENSRLLEEEASRMEKINIILLTTLLIGIGVIGKFVYFISDAVSL